nr:hypothetical protein [Ferruginibacter sp.]
MKKIILLIITVISFTSLVSAQKDTAIWKKKPQKSKDWNPNGGTKENDVWNGGDDKNHKKHQGKANKKNKQWKNDNGQGNDDWKDKDDDSKDKKHKNHKEGKE